MGKSLRLPMVLAGARVFCLGMLALLSVPCDSSVRAVTFAYSGFKENSLHLVSDSSWVFNTTTGCFHCNAADFDSFTGTSGRFLYPDAVQMIDPGSTTVKSFSTSFIYSFPLMFGVGPGMAFIIVPDNVTFGAPGDFMGLISSETSATGKNYESDDHTLGVELDAYMNAEFSDTNNFHIGINLASMNSTFSFEPIYSLASSSAILYQQIWIDYDEVNSRMDIYYADYKQGKPAKPQGSKSGLDLSLLKESTFTGFSTANKIGTFDVPYVCAWSFSNDGIPAPSIVIAQDATPGAPPPPDSPVAAPSLPPPASIPSPPPEPIPSPPPPQAIPSPPPEAMPSPPPPEPIPSPPPPESIPSPPPESIPSPPLSPTPSPAPASIPSPPPSPTPSPAPASIPSPPPSPTPSPAPGPPQVPPLPSPSPISPSPNGSATPPVPTPSSAPGPPQVPPLPSPSPISSSPNGSATPPSASPPPFTFSPSPFSPPPSNPSIAPSQGPGHEPPPINVPAAVGVPLVVLIVLICLFSLCWCKIWRRPLRIFISHLGGPNGAGKNFPSWLHQAMSRQRWSRFKFHVKPFLDVENCPVGLSFAGEILKELERFDVGIVVVTPDFFEKRWPMTELIKFVEVQRNDCERRIHVLPLFYELTPDELRRGLDQRIWEQYWIKLSTGSHPLKLQECRDAVSRLCQQTGVRYISERRDYDKVYIDTILAKVDKILCRERSIAADLRWVMALFKKNLGPNRLLDLVLRRLK